MTLSRGGKKSTVQGIVMFAGSDDRSYVVLFLHELCDADACLKGSKSRYYSAGTIPTLDGLKMIGRHMKGFKPFAKLYDSSRPMDGEVSPDDEYRYRGPVWELVQSVVSSWERSSSIIATQGLETVKGVGSYLIDLAERHEHSAKIKELCDKTVEGFAKLGVNLSVGFPSGRPDPRVPVLYLPEADRFDIERDALIALVESLCSSLEHFIETDGKR